MHNSIAEQLAQTTLLTDLDAMVAAADRREVWVVNAGTRARLSAHREAMERYNAERRVLDARIPVAIDFKPAFQTTFRYYTWSSPVLNPGDEDHDNEVSGMDRDTYRQRILDCIRDVLQTLGVEPAPDLCEQLLPLAREACPATFATLDAFEPA